LFLKRKVRKGVSMKHTKSIIIVFACALFISFSAFGQNLKWEQLPDESGYDWSSATIVPSAVADDWLCENGMPINRIEWWGSYYTPSIFPYENSDNFPDPTIPSNTPQGTVTGFIISVFGDDGPGGDYSWSHPGTLLWVLNFTISEVNETLFGTATKPGGQIENIWQYGVDIDANELFYQDIDTRYWLSIQAIDHEGQSTTQWGWHQTDKALYGYGDDAVQRGFTQNPNIPWDLLVDTEMSFRLYAVPEPSTITILMSSLVFLGLIVRRRQK
jgi:hypothetical protein